MILSSSITAQPAKFLVHGRGNQSLYNSASKQDENEMLTATQCFRGQAVHVLKETLYGLIGSRKTRNY